MRHTRNSRREFLNKLCCLAASGGAASDADEDAAAPKPKRGMPISAGANPKPLNSLRRNREGESFPYMVPLAGILVRDPSRK